MANLPNINTADVGIIAFWNAEDHKTAGVVDPLDCASVFTSYDVYDNGLDGYISLGSGRHFNCRVKNDGWCVAWIDRTNTFFYPSKLASDFGESGHKGYYDILWNWLVSNSNISSTLTTLSYILSLFEATLEASGDFTFVAADVGHYCYEFTNANVLTMMDINHNSAQTAYVQYTIGTTLYYAAIVASCTYGYFGGIGVHAKFEGNGILSNVSPGAAAASILMENWMPDALTDYELKVYMSTHVSNSAHGSILILWS